MAVASVRSPDSRPQADPERALAILVKQQTKRVDREVAKLRRLTAQLVEVMERRTDTHGGHGDEHDGRDD